MIFRITFGTGRARRSRLASQTMLGTIFSSRCQISRVHRPHEIRAHATRSCLFDMTTVTNLFCTDEQLSPDWWSQTGSNRRPPACKAGALPAELWPRKSVNLAGLPAEAAERRRLVGLGRLELPTSRLSSARSNQLSYKPVILWTGRAGAQSLRATTCGPRLVHEERET